MNGGGGGGRGVKGGEGRVKGGGGEGWDREGQCFGGGAKMLGWRYSKGVGKYL